MGLIFDICFNVFGGNDKMKYFISGVYCIEDGIIKNIGYDCFIIWMNIDYKIFDKLMIFIIFNYVCSDVSCSFIGNENEGGFFYGYILVFICDYVDLFLDENGVYLNNFNYVGNLIFVRD